MQADVGCTSNLESLEAAVASSCETLLLDKQAAVTDKLAQFVGPVKDWISCEASNPLHIADVSKHAAFGKLKATVLMNCICPKDDSVMKSTEGGLVSNTCSFCCFHAPEVHLTDIVYEITRAVHQVFPDKFLAFGQVFYENILAGLSD